MDYSDDAFHTFMDLDNAIYHAVKRTVTNLHMAQAEKEKGIILMKGRGSQRHKGKLPCCLLFKQYCLLLEDTPPKNKKNLNDMG